MFFPCPSRVLPMFVPHSSHVHPMFFLCSSHVHPMSTLCSSHVLPMFIPCPPHVHPVFFPCSPHVLPMFIPCSSIPMGPLCSDSPSQSRLLTSVTSFLHPGAGIEEKLKKATGRGLLLPAGGFPQCYFKLALLNSIPLVHAHA